MTSSESESEEDRINPYASESESDLEDDEGYQSPKKKKARVDDHDEEKLPNLCDYMIDRNYRQSWHFQDGIRELVQNTLDGAFVYAERHLGIDSPREIRLFSTRDIEQQSKKKKKTRGRAETEVVPTPQPIVTRKKPPKAIGFEYGYEVLFILVADKIAVTAPVENTTKYRSKHFIKWSNWDRSTDAVACIRCLYGTDNEFDLKKDIKDGYLPGSFMYLFEAENKAINFNIQKILTLGKTTKAYNSNQAGKFGEGLKIGAVAILREDFDLSIQGSGKRCKFNFRKSRMTKDFTRHAKLGKATKRYLDSEVLVGAKLARSKKQYIESFWSGGQFVSKNQNLGGIEQQFPHENYRALTLKEVKANEFLLGKETRSELLLAEHEKGRIFCKSIFVEKKKRLLFGYDLKEAVLPQERNFVRESELRKKVAELLRDLLFDSDLDTLTKKKIMDRIFEMLTSDHCRDVIEAQVLCDDDEDIDARLAKELTNNFKRLHGKEAFPCEESQKEDVEERLPGKKALVVTKTCLEVLQRGGYPTLKAAHDALYSKNNKSRKRIDRSPYSAIVAKALKRMANAGLHLISRENLFFPKTKSACRYKDDLYYLNDALLKGSNVEDESYMLAYHLIQTGGDEDVLAKFIADRNEAVDLDLELKALAISEEAIQVTLSSELFARDDSQVVVYELSADHDIADEDSTDSDQSEEYTFITISSQSVSSSAVPVVITVALEDPTQETNSNAIDMFGLYSDDDNVSVDDVVEPSIEVGKTALVEEAVFRQSCDHRRRFKVHHLKHSTKYIVQAVDLNNVVVKDPHSGERCQVVCRTNLLFKEPNVISIQCFESYQVLSSMGGINTEIGVQFKDDGSPSVDTKWQEDGKIRLEAQEGTELEIFSRERDDIKSKHDDFYTRLRDFNCKIPPKIDHPPTPSNTTMWNTESGCTIRVFYPDELPPNATIIFGSIDKQDPHIPICENDEGTDINSLEQNSIEITRGSSNEHTKKRAHAINSTVNVKFPGSETKHEATIVEISGTGQLRVRWKFMDTKEWLREDAIVEDCTEEPRKRRRCRGQATVIQPIAQQASLSQSEVSPSPTPPAASGGSNTSNEPESSIIVDEQFQQVGERNLRESGALYGFSFQFSKSVIPVAYLSVPMGEDAIKSKTRISLLSKGAEILKIEKPLSVPDVEDAAATQQPVEAENDGTPSSQSVGTTSINDNFDDEKDDCFGPVWGDSSSDDATVDNDDSSDYRDLDDEELIEAFNYEDDDSAYSPDDDLDDPSVNMTDDSCEFEGRTIHTGETYFSEGDKKYYTIKKLFPQRKPPKAECEVDLFLHDTFVGSAASRFFDKNVTVRCEQTTTVALNHLTGKCGTRPSSTMTLQREKNKKEFALYFDDDMESCESGMDNEDPAVLEMFSGIGGMSCGFVNAGFPVKWLVEQDELAAANLKQNHPDSVIFVEDVREFLKNVNAQKPGYPRAGTVWVLHLSPPCQGYSIANRSGGRNDAMNNDLTKCVTSAVEALQPPIVVMENVTAILHEGKSDIFKSVIARLLHMQYQVRVCVLTASDFGDPRLFLFAAKKGYDLPSTPEPTHGEGLPSPTVSVGDAIGDLSRIPPAKLSCGIIKTENGLTYNHKLLPRRKSDEANVLEPDQLAPTTISSSRLQHYSEDRLLTILEYKRLHSFPDEMQLFGPLNKLMKFIGNAVPVQLGTAVAKHVMKSLHVRDDEDDSSTDSSFNASDGRPL